MADKIQEMSRNGCGSKSGMAKATLLSILEEEVIPYGQAAEDIVNLINERKADK